MLHHIFRHPRVWFIMTVLLGFSSLGISQGTLQGKVTDPLGAPVANAKVSLAQKGSLIRQTRTDRKGNFRFTSLPAGRYSVEAEASGFMPTTNTAVFLKAAGEAQLELRLQIGPLRQQVVVSATGQPMLQSQVGASVSVISRDQLEALNKLDVLDALRLVPGVEVVQEGQRGGITSVFVRGGNSDFNKVLIDGIPANDIGGQFDFANLATSGVDHVEVFRGPDSILYGSDALSSAINITTRRGSTSTPEFTYSADGGNFHTLRQEVSIGGAFRQFDYYSDFTRFDTHNSIPNNSFHNGTYAGNFGWNPGQSTEVRLTIHHDATGLGLPGALDFYGIPDDSFQRQQDTYLGLTAQNQTTSRWHNMLRLTSTHIRYFLDNPAPTGIPSNPFGFGANYLGDTVSICGANDYCTTGQAILDFGGSYPELFNSKTTVQSVGGQSDYSFRPDFSVTGGFNYIHEDGFTQSSGSPKSVTRRNNYDYFLEGRGDLWQRSFATAGVGFEDNAVFGFAVTPRVSLAYYLRRPSSVSALGLTKLRFNFGTGIKEPSLLDQGSSLYSLISQLSNGPDLVRRYGISPIGAERSRSFDIGVEQGLWNERALLSITFFHERFYDLIDFVPQSALPELGVPAPVVAEVPFGAYINSDSYRSEGTEAEVEVSLTRNLMLRTEYTYLDAVITQSFASSALFPAFNPAIPNIPIGAYAPLVGNRPFRRPPHSSSFVITYSRHKLGLSFSGTFAGKSDDSTFLTDGFFGNTMLLPNRNLLAGYQLVDFNGWYDLQRHITLYATMGNILDEHYQAAFGYPALPFTIRAGVRFTLGGGERK